MTAPPGDSAPTFVDTWGWLALGHRGDTHHDAVRRTYQRLRDAHAPVYTSDYVLDELITLLFRREVFTEAVRFVEAIFGAATAGQVRIERVSADRFAAAWQLRRRLRDKPRISFTDMLTVTIMQEYGIRYVLTEDEHFTHVGLGLIRIP